LTKFEKLAKANTSENLPWSQAGLPDGMVSDQISKFLHILEDLGMKKVGIFYGNLEFITAIWYILRTFGNLVAILVYFP
jgi:hypothetical protein